MICMAARTRCLRGLMRERELEGALIGTYGWTLNPPPFSGPHPTRWDPEPPPLSGPRFGSGPRLITGNKRCW